MNTYEKLGLMDPYVFAESQYAKNRTIRQTGRTTNTLIEMVEAKNTVVHFVVAFDHHKKFARLYLRDMLEKLNLFDYEEPLNRFHGYVKIDDDYELKIFNIIDYDRWFKGEGLMYVPMSLPIQLPLFYFDHLVKETRI